MSLTIEICATILQASRALPQELRSPAEYRHRRRRGHLVLFERMMAPYGWATGNIKLEASTAVMFNQSLMLLPDWLGIRVLPQYEQ